MDKCDFSAAAHGSTTSQDYVSAARPQKKPKPVRQSPFVDLLSSPGSGIDPFKSCPSSNIPDAELFMHHCMYIPAPLQTQLPNIFRLLKLQVKVLPNGSRLSRETIPAGPLLSSFPFVYVVDFSRLGGRWHPIIQPCLVRLCS